MKSKALNKILLRIGPSLALAWLALVRWTTKFESIGYDNLKPILDRNENYIGAFWHSRLILEGVLFRGTRAIIMIGRHQDAEYYARILRHYGFILARGSSTRGGSSALKAVVDAVKEGYSAGIVPDGPRGPACVAQMGVIEIAKLTGRPIIPVANSIRRRFHVKSWDRMLIPLPFTRGVHIFGEPIHVPPDADEAMMESIRQNLEQVLNELTARADRLVESGTGI